MAPQRLWLLFLIASASCSPKKLPLCPSLDGYLPAKDSLVRADGAIKRNDLLAADGYLQIGLDVLGSRYRDIKTEDDTDSVVGLAEFEKVRGNLQLAVKAERIALDTRLVIYCRGHGRSNVDNAEKSEATEDLP